MAFHEILLPDTLAYGVTFGPVFKTTVVATESGAEQRIAHWARARRQGQIGYGVRNKEQMDALLAFFLARQGKLYGFRFSDANDRAAVNEPLANPGGTVLQLQKTYTSGPASVARLITKPSQTMPFMLSLNGILQTSGYTLDVTTGLVTLAAAAPGGAFTWSGEFDTAVRFDTDMMEVVRDDFDSRHWDGIPIIELLANS